MNIHNTSFENKVALITGGASGIGLAAAKAFIEAGADVIIADINVDLLEKAKERFRGRCETVKTDITKELDIEHAVASGIDRFGSLDICVNSAGLGSYAKITDLSEEEWDTIQNICLKGIFLSMKHEAIRLIHQGQGGVIINISSLNSEQPAEGNAAYCAAKAGVNMLTKTGAMELGPQNIRVCGIAPGLVFTPLTDPIKDMPVLLDAYLENIPLGCVGAVEDIANAIMFLASDQASWITGTTLFVDGGALTKRYPEFPKIFDQMSENNR